VYQIQRGGKSDYSVQGRKEYRVLCDKKGAHLPEKDELLEERKIQSILKGAAGGRRRTYIFS